MRAHVQLLLAATLAAGGCVTTTGKGAEETPVASSPAGVEATVLIPTGMITGELLEVRDTALVLRRGTEVLLIPDASITNVRFKGFDLRTHTRTPDELRRSDFRLLSRYPYGISPAVMAALLSASGKLEPTVVR